MTGHEKALYGLLCVRGWVCHVFPVYVHRAQACAIAAVCAMGLAAPLNLPGLYRLLLVMMSGVSNSLHC